MDFIKGLGQGRKCAENAQRRQRLPSILAAAAAIGCAVVSWPAPSRAQRLPNDLWQTYMAAALANNQSDDFNVEVITLNAALAFAKQHDPKGQRPALTRLPLMLAYAELDRKDLMKPLADEGIVIDVSNLDDRLDDYIDTLWEYGLSYDNRWGAHRNDKQQDDFRQAVRYYGAKNSFRIEVALRTKFRPRDEIGLANTVSLVGLVYRHGDNMDCADFDYGRAIQTFLHYQHERDAMATLGGRFSVGEPSVTAAEQRTLGQAVIDTQVWLVLNAAISLRISAGSALNSKTDPPSPVETNLSAQCDSFGPPPLIAPATGIDAQVTRALEYFDTVLMLTSALRKHWPGSPLFAILYNQIGLTYQIEFEIRKTHPDQYPDALTKAREAFEESLAILTHSDGANSGTARIVATNYVDLLDEAGLTDEASQIKQRYHLVSNN